MTESATLPCSGLTVVELTTTMVSGPMCGQILADMGADVIRLEGLQGEMMRFIHPVRGGVAASFAQFNRNKRSIAVDMKSDKGHEIAWKLIEKADILIENFRAGVADKIGFGYEAVRSRNERLIYVSVNGFGSSGPYADQPAYDMTIQGLVGFMPIQGTKDDPRAIRSVIVDKVTAMAAANAALGAVIHRFSTGRGQKVEVAMMDAWAAVVLPEIMATHAYSDDPEPPAEAPDVYRPIRTKDGHIIGFIGQDRQFAAVCRTLGREDLLAEPRFATPPMRIKLMNEIIGELEKKTVEYSSEDLLALLRATGDVVVAPVNSMTDFFVDPQAVHNGTIYEINDPELGRLKQIKPMANFMGAAPFSKRRAPRHGEQSRELLAEFGYGQEEIAALLDNGVVLQTFDGDTGRR